MISIYDEEGVDLPPQIAMHDDDDKAQATTTD
jgi:hypothetical protein